MVENKVAETDQISLRPGHRNGRPGRSEESNESTRGGRDPHQ